MGKRSERDHMTDHRLELFRQMLRVRRFEERCVELYSGGSIRGFLHLYIGEEAVATGVISQLRPTDAIVATYRDHGHALVRGLSMRSIMAEMFGKADGCSRGRGGSMHLFDSATRFYGGNAIVAGGLPVAAGLALADRMSGREQVTVCFFGEGAVAEGEFHETMNLASLWKLPVLFCCENNLYAMGTALDRSEADTDLAVKATGYAMAAWSVDGMDVEATEVAARRAIDMVRSGGGPVFLELKTYRFRAHSMYDPDRYRDPAEIERWKERDPITMLEVRLRDDGLLDDSALEQLDADIGAEIDDAVSFAESAAPAPLDELSRWVYSDSSTVTTATTTGGAG